MSETHRLPGGGRPPPGLSQAELTPELAAEVRAHLEHCRPCHGHARFEQSFLAHARGPGPPLRLSRRAPRPDRGRELRIEMEQG